MTLILPFGAHQVVYDAQRASGTAGWEVSDVDGVALFGLDRPAVREATSKLPATKGGAAPPSAKPAERTIAPTKLIQRPLALVPKVPRRQAGPATGAQPEAAAGKSGK